MIHEGACPLICQAVNVHNEFVHVGQVLRNRVEEALCLKVLARSAAVIHEFERTSCVPSGGFKNEP